LKCNSKYFFLKTGQFYVMMSPQEVLQNTQRTIAPRTSFSPKLEGRSTRDDRRRATHNEGMMMVMVWCRFGDDGVGDDGNGDNYNDDDDGDDDDDDDDGVDNDDDNDGVDDDDDDVGDDDDYDDDIVDQLVLTTTMKMS
jgi:hypothetical protein